MRKVAIACQGGGSHTAFTAGVLRELLPWLAESEHRLVGLSGTSGGAVSAVTGWYGLQAGGGRAAADTIDDLWADLVVDGPVEWWLNKAMVYGTRARAAGAPVPRVSPYFVPGAGVAKRQFLETLRRHVDFEELAAMAGPPAPKLVVGTVNVTAGAFETFEDGGVTAEAVLASSAVPTLFEAVELDGQVYWDGLFSQNPPIHELMAVEGERTPDELWVIQVTPQRNDEAPHSLADIQDRRSELAGNLSLNQELRFVERVNDWLEDGALTDVGYSMTEIRRLSLDRELGYASALDRTPTFVDSLLEAGEGAARDFLDRVEPDLE